MSTSPRPAVTGATSTPHLHVVRSGDPTVTLTIASTAKTFKWEERTLTIPQLDRELCEHEIRQNKDGACWVSATLLGGKRNLKSVDKVWMLTYDIDGSMTWDEVYALLDDKCMAYLYTTFSHKSTRTEIVVDHYDKWSKSAKQPQTPTLESLMLFLKEHKKGHLKNPQYDTMEGYERVADKGNCFIVTHDSVDKLRVIFPLEKPIDIGRLDPSNQKAVEIYKSIYNAVAQAVGLVDYDTTCSDPCKLFYLPSCPPDKAHFAKVEGFEGPFLDWEKIPRADVPKSKQKAANDNKRDGASKDGPVDVEFNGVNLSRSKVQARDFDVEGLLQSRLPDEILGVRDKGGHFITCPFEHEHSDAGGMGTFVANADGEFAWSIYCSHNSCQGEGRKRLDFLKGWLENGAITLEDLGLNAKTPYELPICESHIIKLDDYYPALSAMNDRWCVVNVGGKTRMLTFDAKGDPEFLDKSNFRARFEATYYEYMGKDGIELANFGNAWLRWPNRRQFAGYGFFPAPDGHPDAAPPGSFNIYRGFSVESRMGDWGLLQRHLYRNICQRHPVYFRWLMAWLAQLIQQPHIKPGTHVVLIGNEGVGKSKLGEWLIQLLSPAAMPITAGERLVGRFNAHFEGLLFALAEEVFWAGDKAAEGVIKALATANEMDYERKGLDPVGGRNYTRMMIASNNPWVVPAWSGGRRWFVLKVGDEHEKDYRYFAAIDAQMENGGLEAMLYDLQHSPLASTVQVRDVPVTPWLIEQRAQSRKTDQRWWHSVLSDGGFTIVDPQTKQRRFVALNENEATAVSRDHVFDSAEKFFSRVNFPATKEGVGAYLKRELGEEDKGLFRNGPRKKSGRTYWFASAGQLRQAWFDKYGEEIEGPESEPPSESQIKVSEAGDHPDNGDGSEEGGAAVEIDARTIPSCRG
jgi:hypothetical protein